MGKDTRAVMFQEVLVQSTGGVDDDWLTLLDALVRQYGRFYHRLAYGVLHRNEAAADVCQQAYLRAWERRDQIRDSGALRSWLARVVINESFLVLRRSETEQRVLAARSGWVGGQQAAVEASDRRDLVVVAMARLPEPVRTVVALRVMQGLSGNEVSRLLGSNASEVSRRLHEGLDQLRLFLGNGDSSGG